MKALCFITALIAVLIFTWPIAAANRTVPTQYTTIQAAIDDCNHGDVVIVEPNTYTGDGNRDIDFNGLAITVRSTDPNDPNIVAITIIDCNASDANRHRGFHFHSGEDNSSVLDGFTIINGFAESGGAIYAQNNSKPTITNCTITNNTATKTGGGLYGCNGPISNCTISANLSQDTGGAMMFCSGSISNCNITSNSALWGGGLVHCYGSITNCTITANSAQNYSGGMLYCDGVIANCIISGNSAGSYGGGLAGCNGAITNCTIVGNAAGDGGALSACDGSISNCIIWDNRSGNSPNAPLDDDSTVPLYSCVQNGSNDKNCISSDPCFVSPGQWDANGTPGDFNDDSWVDGDYHLLPESPCINRGNYTYCMYLPYTDRDGNCRLGDSQIDMGCYEANSLPDADGDWLPDACEPGYTDNPDRDNDDILDGLELLCAMDPNTFNPLGQWDVPNDVNTVQGALFFSRPGETIELAQSTYYENICIGGRNIILTSADPCDSNVVAATILNADTDTDSNTPNGHVITFAGTENAGCRIFGLTITGGDDDNSGGGIYGAGTHGTITYCTITENLASSSGGGIYDCDGQITNCNVIDNSAMFGGGLKDCDGEITNCKITGNSAIQSARAIAGGGVGPEPTPSGGGLYNCNGLFSRCIISGNIAAGYGGAICYSDSGDTKISNCTIIGNSAQKKGGGLYHRSGNVLTIINCIFVNNTNCAISERLTSYDPQVTYCLFYNNPDGDWYDRDSSSILTGADAINTLPEASDNIDADPCFVTSGHWADANDPNTAVEPNDPNAVWVDGDYHLLSQGLRWNYSSEEWVQDVVTSRAIDAGNPGSLLADEPPTVPPDPNNESTKNLRINMGAYGGTKQASIAPYGWALLADITNDGIVDFVDFARLADILSQNGDELPADFDRDGDVELADLALLINDWLQQTTWH